MKIHYYFLAALFFLLPLTIFAHPGGLDSSGGHHCWTNCESWGYAYGQWHSHGGGSSYTSTPYVSSYKTNLDCPSYGFAYLGSCYELPDNARKSAFSGFTCNYGYDEVGYGLSKKCLPEIDNGYRIGSFTYCNYGYELYYGKCLKENSGIGYGYGLLNSSLYDYDFDSLYSCPKNSSEDPDDSDMCICDVGYDLNKDKDGCKKISKKTNDKLCKADFGKSSIWSGKYDKEDGVALCKCKKGFEWNSKGTSCMKEAK